MTDMTLIVHIESFSKEEGKYDMDYYFYAIGMLTYSQAATLGVKGIKDLIDGWVKRNQINQDNNYDDGDFYHTSCVDYVLMDKNADEEDKYFLYESHAAYFADLDEGGYGKRHAIWHHDRISIE